MIRVDFYRRGMALKIARYPAIFFFTVDYLGNNSLLDPSRFKRNTLFFFFNLFRAADCKFYLVDFFFRGRGIKIKW